MFPPRSPQAQDITNLFILTLVLAGGILLLVTGLVVTASLRFRQRGEAGEPTQKFGNRKLEMGWTIGPALLLAALFVLMLTTMSKADPPVPVGRQPDIVIVAHQWWWQVTYPKSGVVTANEIHIPVGPKLLVRIESADVIHDFWVPQLARKIDAVPGQPNHIWLQADQPGLYEGACAEYCGAQHAWMRIRVYAESPSDFDAWQAHQLQPALAPDSELAAEGARLFQSRTCSSCHTIAGTGAAARIGPDLTHVASRDTLAAGVMANTSAYMTGWLANPQAIKPGNHMPNLKLEGEEIIALVAYLEELQ